MSYDFCKGRGRYEHFDSSSMPFFEYQGGIWGCSLSRDCPDGSDYKISSAAINLRNIDCEADLKVHLPDGYSIEKAFRIGDNIVYCMDANLCLKDANGSIDDSADDGLSARAIAEIVATGILAAAAIGLCLRWCYRSYCNRGNDNQQTEEIGLNLMDSQQSEGLALQNGGAEFSREEEQLSDIDQGSNAEVPITLEGHPAAPSGRPSGIISRIWSIMPGFIRKTQEEAASVV